MSPMKIVTKPGRFRRSPATVTVVVPTMASREGMICILITQSVDGHKFTEWTTSQIQVLKARPHAE